ncbi:protein kinase A [Geosmithia morbida]|uniref:cAMP-dependent protein kinase n=1 Tax=Geosmithia morbida TaxID=1094350 RepID=A0A9P4YZX2_9HYPO|nr:protein kinase A [Geosmithia morbida]KAF4124708.1 protein kinase A [Geosmithia morbida]
MAPTVEALTHAHPAPRRTSGPTPPTASASTGPWRAEATSRLYSQHCWTCQRALGTSSPHFSLVRTLGTVQPVQHSSSSSPSDQSFYALKILRKTEIIKLKQIDHVRHERSILAEIAGHPFITCLRASFSDRDSLYMLLDYVPGGELFSYLRRLRRFDEHTARFYAAEIVCVLQYLHEDQGGVAYRDLKPENLLLDAAGHIKLVDFGFAKRLGGRKSGGDAGAGVSADGAAAGDHDKPVETYTLCGTPEYLAPEVIHNKGHSAAVDWWALGILLYEFLTGYPPFWHQNPIEIYKQIIEKPLVFPREPQISDEAKSIILSFCTKDRSHRLGNISGGAQRVKEHPFFRGVNWDDISHARGTGPIIPPVRFPGDAQCFDNYPEDDGSRRVEYTAEMAQEYDRYFSC